MAGERVVEVPQAYRYLLDVQDVRAVVGCQDGVLARVTDGTFPRGHWITYHHRRDPMPGFGLLVVRNGRCYRGPAQWETD
jgi:hypothetical protein